MQMLRNTADSKADHRRFVTRVAVSETVWVLRNAEGVAWCESNDNPQVQVLLFWSDKAYAARAQQGHFPGYEISSIHLFDFLFRWLCGMSDDRVLAGTNWTGDLVGLEVNPDALLDELIGHLEDAKRADYGERLRQGIEKQKGRERA